MTRRVSQAMLRKAQQQRYHQAEVRRQATPQVPRSVFSESFCVYQNYYGKTCITIARANHAVRFIMLDTDMLRVEQRGVTTFHHDWVPLDEYPVERAAAIYCAYARLVGANVEAWNWLQQILVRTTVNGENLPIIQPKDETIMPTPQRPLRNPQFQQELQSVQPTSAPRGPRTVQTADVASPPPVPTRRGRRPAAENGAVTDHDATPRERQSRGPTASSMFKELILNTDVQGSTSYGWTDDEIFAAVQDAYGLDDTRRSYVAWYRNDLRKKGHNPPEAIRAEKADAPAANGAPARAPRASKGRDATPMPAAPTRTPRAPRRSTAPA